GGDVHVGDVLGDELVEFDVEARRDGDRGEDHHDSQRALQQQTATGASCPLEEPAPAQRQREQDERRPGRVGDGDRDRAPGGRAGQQRECDQNDHATKAYEPGLRREPVGPALPPRPRSSDGILGGCPRTWTSCARSTRTRGAGGVAGEVMTTYPPSPATDENA